MDVITCTETGVTTMNMHDILSDEIALYATGTVGVDPIDDDALAEAMQARRPARGTVVRGARRFEDDPEDEILEDDLDDDDDDDDDLDDIDDEDDEDDEDDLDEDEDDFDEDDEEDDEGLDEDLDEDEDFDDADADAEYDDRNVAGR